MSKIKITERQLSLLTSLIKEDSINNEILVKQVSEYLTKYYKPTVGRFKKSGSYNDTPMFINKIDDEIISPENLLRHLKEKFTAIAPEYLSQIVRDWYDGKLNNDFLLSKNLSPNQ